MNRKYLESYANFFNKQKGQAYPCSNQSVICGVIINDMDRAIAVMEEKGARMRLISSYRIEWELDNELWMWADWNKANIGRRFYNILVDENIDEEFFKEIVVPMCGMYCCSMEII